MVFPIKLSTQAEAPRNAAEAEFCARRLMQRNEALARSCITLAVPYHLVSLLTDRFIVAEADAPLFLAAHLFFLTMYSSWLLKLRNIRFRTAYFLWPLQLGFVAFLGFIMHRTIERDANTDIVLAASGLTLASAVMILLCPFSGRMLVVSGLLYGLVGAFAVWESPLSPRWIVVDALAIVVIIITQHLSISKTRQLALSEYRTMRLIAPEQIVRGAASADDASLETLFQPMMRPVACVSSDWRGYQAYSRGEEPAEVARTLNEYYELCSRLLREVSPEGNYYTDWIADELFIVFYGKPKSSTRHLVDQAISFSQRLITEKRQFLKTHQMPQALDIGVATGFAYVGLMGSSEYRKATALGEVPGLSRRLQGTGKLLRSRLGHGDRIIIDEQTADWLGPTTPVRRYKLTPNDVLRDLETRIILYLASKPAAISAVYNSYQDEEDASQSKVSYSKDTPDSKISSGEDDDNSSLSLTGKVA